MHPQPAATEPLCLCLVRRGFCPVPNKYYISFDSQEYLTGSDEIHYELDPSERKLVEMNQIGTKSSKKLSFFWEFVLRGFHSHVNVLWRNVWRMF